MDVELSHIDVNGVRLHVAEAGPKHGRLVILLHGFPEYWEAWQRYFEPLAAAGYRVLAPDQRGYNLSDKPSNVAAYDLNSLARDVLGLADHFERRRFAIVGHDWGAAVGWWIATCHAERLEQFVALSAPHPSVWREAMQSHPEQRRKSQYVRFFQLPRLPEALLRLRRFKALADAVRQRARPDTVTAAALDRYRAAWRAPGALTGMLNWYRALWRKDLPASAKLRIRPPVLLIWGERDAFAVRALAEASLLLCESSQAVYLGDATHWVQHDEPERCIEALLDFLGRSTGQSPSD
ncbi:alpha/beta fold hydrolase [Bradyrhizobium mercantei]|uniref:alpha/beta fold hydrolase n=1 Tax=Bradyrhizobium mercantei TaxID=1904807 RepID=UPI0009763BBD|nr:alpha/beta hydrolase [Bradyrhizobium mercantei]